MEGIAGKRDKRIWFRSRPFGSEMSATLAPSSRALADARANGLEQFAKSKQLSQVQIVDHLLLFLWYALFFDASVRWTEDGVANLDADRTRLLARAFIQGQKLAMKPLHDGICAFCGALLHPVY